MGTPRPCVTTSATVSSSATATTVAHPSLAASVRSGFVGASVVEGCSVPLPPSAPGGYPGGYEGGY